MSDGLSRNVGTIAAGLGGVAAGSVIGYTVASRSHKKKTKKHRKTSHAKHYGKLRKSRRRKYSYSKRNKRVSHKRIHYTKTGQPYVILSTGKARFIKKSGARRSRHMKGGRY